MSSETTIREATSEDAPIIMGMIRELAEFEKMPHDVHIDDKVVAEDIARKAVNGILLFEGDVPAGMVLWYFAYSTWEGQYIHMEDLYIKPDFRRKGYGKQLWVALAKVAKEKGCKRFHWNVLDWNTPAINFYKTTPVKDLTKEGWLLYRLGEEAIANLANSI